MRNRLPVLPVIGFAGIALAIQPGEPMMLEPGKTLAGELGGKQSAEYQFALDKGQYAQVVVEQRSVNVSLACFGPDGKEVMSGDVYWIGEPEMLELIGSLPGAYRVRVTASDPEEPAGRYTITLTSVEPATEKARHRVAGAAAYIRAAKAALVTPYSQREVLAAYQDALKHWHAAGDRFEEARSTYGIGNILAYAADGADRQRGYDYLIRALPIARANGVPRSEGWALHYIGEYHNNYGDKKKAIEYHQQALPLMRASGDRAGEGHVLNALGTALARTGEKRKALECFEQAFQAMSDIQDRRRAASISGNMGVTYSDLAEYPRALDSHHRALDLHRAMKNRVGEAITLNNIGTVLCSMAQYQKALEEHLAALEINRSLKSRGSTAVDLNNIAYIYSTLGDRRRALNYYQESVDILRTIKEPYNLGHGLNNLAEAYAALGNDEKALVLHEEGLALRRVVKDPGGEAVSLSNLGRLHAKLGKREEALHDFERAVELLRESKDPRQLAATLKNFASVLRQGRDFAPARGHLIESLALSRRIQDPRGEASSLVEMAKLERDCGNLDNARQRSEEALARLEGLRLSVTSPALRASFFASAKEVQEIEIDALVRRHEPGPALEVVERGRARSLLEMLGESGAEIRHGVDTVLLDCEKDLVRLISATADRQTRLLSGKHSAADVATVRKQLDGLTADLEQVRSRIRATSPQYAALTQPSPLGLKEIQSQVLDDDTVLLEYSLGAERSFVWAVAHSSADVFVLPARAEVEDAAKRVYTLLTARNGRPPNETAEARAARLRRADQAWPAVAEKLSRMLLGPVASRIDGKRLLIVADGALQYLPFSALPDPAGGSPLTVKHEIIMAPSASVVAVMRRETDGRAPAERQLAVVADPVFSTDDARITETTRSATATSQDFARLRFSRREAEDIVRLLPARATFKALDFDASRETVLRPDFGRHRIVHFATHSVLNNERPELSGVVLSLVDRSGKPRDGFLRLYEIYNLRLAADLVVLSACQTALGGDITGEGLIGLTRGFLYAGARRVVSSLWEVDDRTSAELMKRFYEAMLVRGERPAAALRAAQVAMWSKKGWDAPYYWAAYTMQGEWR